VLEHNLAVTLIGWPIVEGAEHLIAAWNARQKAHMPMLFLLMIGAVITPGTIAPRWGRNQPSLLAIGRLSPSLTERP
jgi:hypothetical protein